MYEASFGFSQRPFAAAPQAQRFFPSASIDAARQTLLRCIERSEGAGLLIGAAGTGKTLLLQVLAEAIGEKTPTEKLSVVQLTGGRLESRRELLQAILFELKLPYQGMEEGELRLALVDHLTRGDDCPGGLLLLVDEAHGLDAMLLEELRMMTNLAREGESRVRLVLAGNLELEEIFASPQLETFSQRVAARCYLETFDRAETCDYIRFQVAVAGGRVERVFAPDALDAVYSATDGVPRLVNQLCDHALLLAHANGRPLLDAAAIDEAWADLQQLPAPWQGSQEQGSASTAEVVEFGSLEDDDADSEEPGHEPAEFEAEANDTSEGEREHVVLDFRSTFENAAEANGNPDDSNYQVLQDGDELQVVVDPYSGLKEPEDEDEEEVVPPVAGESVPHEAVSVPDEDEPCEAPSDVPACELEEHGEDPTASPVLDERPMAARDLETADVPFLEAAQNEPAQADEAIDVAPVVDPGVIDPGVIDPGVIDSGVIDDGMEEEIVSDRYADLDDQLTKCETGSACGTDPVAADDLENAPLAEPVVASEPVPAMPAAEGPRIPLSEAMRRRIEAETAAAFARTLAEAEACEAPEAIPFAEVPTPPGEEDAAEYRGNPVRGTLVVDPEELRARSGVRQPAAGDDDPELVRDEQLAQELSDVLGTAELQQLRRIEAPAAAAPPPPEHEDAHRDDIVVIDDEGEEYVEVPETPEAPPHRVEKHDYKSLFARLRRES